MFIATDAKQQRWNCLEKIPMKKEGLFSVSCVERKFA